MENKRYIVVVQCHIVMERCSGYLCERSFDSRTGLFADYPADKDYRTLYITCGGCCGRAVHRKLGDLTRMIKKTEDVTKEEIVVHLASCITHDNFHAPRCPHIDYLKTLIAEKAGFDIVEGTYISKLSTKRREKGEYVTY